MRYVQKVFSKAETSIFFRYSHLCNQNTYSSDFSIGQMTSETSLLILCEAVSSYFF